MNLFKKRYLCAKDKCFMTSAFRLDKTAVRVVKLESQGTDFFFWQSQPEWKRLAALEAIRQEYHHWKYGTEPRLQRVFTIVKRA